MVVDHEIGSPLFKRDGDAMLGFGTSVGIFWFKVFTVISRMKLKTTLQICTLPELRQVGKTKYKLPG